MAKAEFQYKGIITTIQCQEDQKISEIFNNFENKSNINESQINYSYNGRIITSNDKNLIFNQLANSLDKERKKICVLAYDNNI